MPAPSEERNFSLKKLDLLVDSKLLQIPKPLRQEKDTGDLYRNIDIECYFTASKGNAEGGGPYNLLN